MDLATNINADPVMRLRPTASLSVQRDCTIADAVKLMRQKAVGCLLVCDGKKLAGVFTERDLIVRVFAAGRPMTDLVGDVMTIDPVSVTTRDTIRKAIARMDKGHRHLPVIDDAGRPVGILSVKRVVHYLVEHFPATVHNLPPDAAAYPTHRGGA